MSVRILIGDVFDKMAEIEDESVDVCVSSPPYWGLRDYGVEGQIGLEPTLGEHLDVMVRVCAEIHRVLKPTGTFWLNYGDCYATAPNGRSAADTKAKSDDDRGFVDKPFSTIGPVYAEGSPSTVTRHASSSNSKQTTQPPSGRVMSGGYMKPKDLCLIPARLAIALQEWGWWVRSEIFWTKPNPMPESVSDRPATAHEKIWLLSKAQRYHYDPHAVRQGRVSDKDADGFLGGSYTGGKPGKRKKPGNKPISGWDSGPGSHSSIEHNRGDRKDKQRGHGCRHAGFNDRWDQMSREEQSANGRNLRNYEPAPAIEWNMPTRPFRDAHFATFPPELVERCLKAGCPPGGTVLDPFGGAGTTGLVADRMGFDCTLIELNPEYADIARNRINSDAGPLTQKLGQGVA